MVVVRAFGQRMHQYIEAVAVEHQPRHDVLELRVLENHIELRDRMRAARFVAECTGLDLESAEDRLAQLRRLRLGIGVVIDVGVKSSDFAHLSCSFDVLSYACSCAAIFWLISARHSSMGLKPGCSRQ